MRRLFSRALHAAAAERAEERPKARAVGQDPRSAYYRIDQIREGGGTSATVAVAPVWKHPTRRRDPSTSQEHQPLPRASPSPQLKQKITGHFECVLLSKSVESTMYGKVSPALPRKKRSSLGDLVESVHEGLLYDGLGLHLGLEDFVQLRDGVVDLRHTNKESRSGQV